MNMESVAPEALGRVMGSQAMAQLENVYNPAVDLPQWSNESLGLSSQPFWQERKKRRNPIGIMRR